MWIFSKKKRKIERMIRFNQEELVYINKLGIKKLDDEGLDNLYCEMMFLYSYLGNIETMTDEMLKELILIEGILNKFGSVRKNYAGWDYEYNNQELTKFDSCDSSVVNNKKSPNTKDTYRLTDESICYLKRLGYEGLKEDDLADLSIELFHIDGDLGNIENRSEEEQRELDLEYALSNELDYAEENNIELDYEYINNKLKELDKR